MTGDTQRTLLHKLLSQQETTPLQHITVLSASAFTLYLRRYDLHPLDVAFASRVRYLTVWNIQHGIPVSPAHAAQVRQGLEQMTNVPYTAVIAVRT